MEDRSLSPNRSHQNLEKINRLDYNKVTSGEIDLKNKKKKLRDTKNYGLNDPYEDQRKSPTR